MVSRLSVPIPACPRFCPWARLVAGAVLAVLVLLGAGNAAAAVQPTRTAADTDAHRPPGLDLSTKKAERPDEDTRRGESESALADRVLDRGRALLDRYGSERLLLAVVVGALVQVLCLFLVRLIGTFLRLATRGLAWSCGVAVALCLLGGSASLPVSAAEAADRFGRLADLIGRVA
jgi:hypothetical protein